MNQLENIEEHAIDYDKMNTIKEELLKVSEEFLYAEKKTSAASSTDSLLKLVRKEYDF